MTEVTYHTSMSILKYVSVAALVAPMALASGCAPAVHQARPVIEFNDAVPSAREWIKDNTHSGVDPSLTSCDRPYVGIERSEFTSDRLVTQMNCRITFKVAPHELDGYAEGVVFHGFPCVFDFTSDAEVDDVSCPSFVSQVFQRHDHSRRT